MATFESLRRRTGRLAMPGVIALVFVAGFAFGNQQFISRAAGVFAPSAQNNELFAPFWQVYQMIDDHYVDPEGDPVDPQKLVDGAINGMMEALDDEFSGYMDAETYPLINQEMEGEVQGIGVTIRTNEDTGAIEVVSVMADTPAQEAGMRPGDIFMAVNGEDVSQASQTELAQKVRGPEGSELTITIQRGDERIDFTMQRALLIIPMVESEVLNGDIAYVRLNQFGSNARGAIDSAIEDMDEDTLQGLILDLRGNPGGLLSSAIDVSSAFLEDGTLLVEDFGDGNEQIFDADGSYNGLDVPMVVLVDETSASASELVAGALQDNGRATVIGEITFGKGTVQTWQALSNGGGVRLTVARWLTPERNWIHHLGITPDILIEWNPVTYAEDEPDAQLDAALDFLQAEISAQTE